MSASEFGLKVQVGIGRDLRLPQYSSLQVCRVHAEVILQMYEDGYAVEEVISYVIQQAGDPDDLLATNKMAATF